MWARSILIIAGVVAAVPALAGELRPEEAKRFVAGKHFTYSCFDGTSGSGRINADGSVIGTMQARNGPLRFISLPTGTIRVQPDSICASVKGMMFTPCFTVYQLDNNRFRGAISGLGFAYCDFVRRNPRMELTGTRASNSPNSQRASANE
jgi:hypothetical protein